LAWTKVVVGEKGGGTAQRQKVLRVKPVIGGLEDTLTESTKKLSSIGVAIERGPPKKAGNSEGLGKKFQNGVKGIYRRKVITHEKGIFKKKKKIRGQ